MRLEYLGGFFDGEGCILIPRSRGRVSRSVHLVVAGVDIRPLKLFQGAFGGRIHPRQMSSLARLQSYTYCLTLTEPHHRDVIDALSRVTLIKRTQLRVASRYLRGNTARFGRKDNLPPSEIERREFYHTALKRLKRMTPSLEPPSGEYNRGRTA